MEVVVNNHDLGNYMHSTLRTPVPSHDRLLTRQRCPSHPTSRNAALQRRMFADGFVPNSPEFDVEIDGIDYRAQRSEHLETGKVRVYYAAVGDWDNVRFIERA